MEFNETEQGPSCAAFGGTWGRYALKGKNILSSSSSRRRLRGA